MRYLAILVCAWISGCKAAAPLPEPPRAHPASPHADEAPVPELQSGSMPHAPAGGY